jgi:4-hydroxy-tetrahydrodipicolinate reductase
MIKIGVVGVGGRMGSLIARAVLESPSLDLAGAMENAGHPAMGRDLGEILGRGTLGVRVTSEAAEAFGACDGIIDFTFPEVTMEVARYAAGQGRFMVIGTTGFTDAQRQALAGYAAQVPMVLSPNMSIGVNVLFRVVKMLAGLLDESYDVEIVEAHHRLKKDAPSGTALALARAAAEGRGVDLGEKARYERYGMIGARPAGEIGIQTVRAGDIVGEHTVMFAGNGERVEVVHKAHTRENFARGAVRAAAWVAGRKPGMYSMADVLGIGDEDR